MRKIILSTALIVLMSASSVAGSSGSWRISKNMDPMTDRVTVSASLVSETSASRKLEFAQFICTENGLSFSLKFGRHRFTADPVDVTYRLDVDSAKTLKFTPILSGEYLMVSEPESAELLKEMLDAEKLLVRASDMYRAPTRAVQYHTKGLPEAAKVLLSACP